MNRLAEETSPYLLQHKDNPVEWYPWGEEALRRAREEDKPILVSIGYSACHWCHVMERESFEDSETAAYMNQAVRPGQGGPGGAPRRRRPVHGGGPGDDGARRLAAHRVPRPRRRALLRRNVLPARASNGDAELSPGDGGRGRGVEHPPRPDRSRRAAHPRPARRRRPNRALEGAARRGDPHRGGRAPSRVRRHAQRRLRGRAEVPAGVRARVPARPGRDRRGRGDARRDGRRRHLRPGGRRLRALLRRRRVARPPLREDAVRQRAARADLSPRMAGARPGALPPGVRGDAPVGAAEMRGPEGGFQSALDADSEGEEGRFYVWTPDEIRDALEAEGLGDARRRRSPYLGVTEAGNFEGRSILHLPAGRRPHRPTGSTRSVAPCTSIARAGCGRAATTSGSPRGTR